MNIFELKIWDDERSKCTFYTVQWIDTEISETDKFLIRYETSHSDAIQQLLSFILKAVGEDHGAVDALFNRFENEVVGLPNKGNARLGEFKYHYPEFPLRLYALKITDNIVVLFDGGVKDGPTNQASSLQGKWQEACHFAKRILEEIRDKNIQVDEYNKLLTNHLGESEIII